MRSKVIAFVLIMAFTQISAQESISDKIEDTLDAWHKAASEADFDTYFGLMTNDGVFIGTDAT